MATGKLIPVAVETRYHVEVLRYIRNSCASYMTRHCDIISIEQQQLWWKTINRDTWQIYLYWYGNMAVGFGVLRLEDGKYWVTGGLLENARGHGLGRELFTHLINFVKDDIWLEVLETNTIAHKLYMKLGFVETGRKDGVITMTLTKAI